MTNKLILINLHIFLTLLSLEVENQSLTVIATIFWTLMILIIYNIHIFRPTQLVW